MIKKTLVIIILSFLFITELVNFSKADSVTRERLETGKKLPSFSVSEGKEKLIFPDDFDGDVFAIYFGNITNNNDGYEFLSWGGAFTIALRQSDEILSDVFFTGIASLRARPLYWVPYLVKRAFKDEMNKNDVRGEIYYDFKGEISKKFRIQRNEVRAVVVDKKGIIRKVYEHSVYDLDDDELDELYDLFIELFQEETDE